MSLLLQERTPAVQIVVRNIVFMRLLVHDVLVTGFENLTHFAEAGFQSKKIFRTDIKLFPSMVFFPFCNFYLRGFFFHFLSLICHIPFH